MAGVALRDAPRCDLRATRQALARSITHLLLLVAGAACIDARGCSVAQVNGHTGLQSCRERQGPVNAGNSTRRTVGEA